MICQKRVDSDGVSEEGVNILQIQHLFVGFKDVESLCGKLTQLDWQKIPQDTRKNILISNHSKHYGEVSQFWNPHLHIVLWNPYQSMDVSAPSLITWGYADASAFIPFRLAQKSIIILGFSRER